MLKYPTDYSNSDICFFSDRIRTGRRAPIPKALKRHEPHTVALMRVAHTPRRHGSGPQQYRFLFVVGYLGLNSVLTERGIGRHLAVTSLLMTWWASTVCLLVVSKTNGFLTSERVVRHHEKSGDPNGIPVHS